MVKGSKHKLETIEKLRNLRLGKPGYPHKKGIPISKNAIVKCIDCGIIVINTTINRKRCDVCKIKAKNASGAAFKKRNIDKIRADNNAYWKRIRLNPARREDLIFRSRLHRENNKEYFREKAKEWRKNNPELKRQRDNRRRALKRNAYGNHTLAQFFDLCEQAGWKCFYCGKKLNKRTASRDHVIPLSRGGSDSIDNIIPSCIQCNQIKQAKTIEEFLLYKEINA